MLFRSAKHEYDFILLDCTPSLGMLTVNALAAADTTLIPVQAQYLSAKGLEQLLQTVQKVRRQINPKLKIEGILLTMTDSRTNYGKQISNLIRQAYGKHLKVFEQTIPRSVRLKFTAVRDVFLQNEDGTPSTQLKKRIYDLKCSLHGGIIPVSVPPEVPLREFPYNAVVELVNPVADTVSRKTYTGADVDWYVKAEDIVLKNKGNQNAGSPQNSAPQGQPKK